MSILNIRIDLKKLKNAAVANITGKTATKACLIIPIEDAGLYLGEKGCYLNMSAFETQNSQYGDTHFVKQNIDKEVFATMTDEERKAMPILGSIKPVEPRTQLPTTTVTVENSYDLPF